MRCSRFCGSQGCWFQRIRYFPPGVKAPNHHQNRQTSQPELSHSQIHTLLKGPGTLGSIRARLTLRQRCLKNAIESSFHASFLAKWGARSGRQVAFVLLSRKSLPFWQRFEPSLTVGLLTQRSSTI